MRNGMSSCTPDRDTNLFSICAEKKRVLDYVSSYCKERYISSKICQLNFCQILDGSFSAVMKPIFCENI